MFIVFEGIDGTGKSTQARLLEAELNKRGILKTYLTREPGGTALGKRIREVITSDEMRDGLTTGALDCLFLADHIQHVEEIIKPKLAEGYLVISDRYAYSQFAYESFGASNPHIREAYRASIGPTPDIVFLLTDIPEAAHKRANGRVTTQDAGATGGNRQSKKKWNSVEKLGKIQEKYLEVLGEKVTRIQVGVTEEVTHGQIMDQWDRWCDRTRSDRTAKAAVAMAMFPNMLPPKIC